MKVCVLLSGGMDSVTAFYEALATHEVVGCLSFNYGSKHNHCEIPFARLHSERNGVPHHTVSLGFMNELFKSDLLQSGGDIPEGHYAEDTMKKTVVPFRNGIMLKEAGIHITIETAGTIAPEGIPCDLASLSPKLANSTPSAELVGAAWVERHERTRLQPEILRQWIDSCTFQLKFVVSDEGQLAEIRELLLSLDRPIPTWKTLLMPEGVTLEALGSRREPREHPRPQRLCRGHI